jgi:hypothetical protein
VYGADRFLDNFAEMDVKLGRFTRLYWKVNPFFQLLGDILSSS